MLLKLYCPHREPKEVELKLDRQLEGEQVDWDTIDSKSFGSGHRL